MIKLCGNGIFTQFTLAAGVLYLTLLSSILIECQSLYLPGFGEKITKMDRSQNPDGSYDFNFETSQGIQREEKGFFEKGIWTVKGIVSWVAPDNKLYGYSYTADDKGYQQIDMEPEDGDTRTDPKTRKGLLSK